MDHSEVIAGGREARAGPAPSGRLEEVVDEFVLLPRRRLVVIGEPGAGKTGVPLLLTLGLLTRLTPADPVPVLFSLASWDPARTRFPQWLARHLSDESGRSRGAPGRSAQHIARDAAEGSLELGV